MMRLPPARDAPCFNVCHGRRDLPENCDESSIDLFSGLKRCAGFSCYACRNCSSKRERSETRFIPFSSIAKGCALHQQHDAPQSDHPWIQGRLYDEAHQDGSRSCDQRETTAANERQSLVSHLTREVWLPP
jgi:hypothetical protein